jgi:pimeloyl-ACP methyl ester carboxylesterase
LVVVPGALSDQTAWTACAPLLAVGRSVHVIDRRGRGASGDARSSEPDREVEDVLAGLAAVGGGDLLGHSSGAVLALQAAERAPEDLQRLVLYEPPLFFNAEDAIPSDLPERLDALVAAGDEDGALQTFLREGPRAPESDIQDLRSHGTAWQRLLAMARTVPYDARIVRDFDTDLRRLIDMRTPTLMLIGEDSPPRTRRGSEAIARALPDVRIEALPGQGHHAQFLAPEMFADAVDRFLTGD